VENMLNYINDNFVFSPWIGLVCIFATALMILGNVAFGDSDYYFIAIIGYNIFGIYVILVIFLGCRHTTDMRKFLR